VEGGCDGFTDQEGPSRKFQPSALVSGGSSVGAERDSAPPRVARLVERWKSKPEGPASRVIDDV